MTSVVVKIDSFSLSTPENIEQISKRIVEEKKRGRNIIVVVSSEELLEERYRKFAYALSKQPSKRELDVLQSIGSQATSALLAIAIQQRGFKAVSLTGWQAGIETVEVNQKVRIEQIKIESIINYISKGDIPIVAGSQGFDCKNNKISILGMGGSDTTAVAIAAAIEAECVEILTNSEGIYTADPSIVPQAKKLKQISYDELLELTHLGSKIVHPRAVEMAKKYDMPIIVRSSTRDIPGTLIKGEVEMEKNLIVRGVAYEAEIIRLTVGYEKYEHASLANIFTTLAEHQIDVDIIVQSVIDGVKPTVSFSIDKEDFADAIKVLESNKSALGFSFADFEVGLAKVSIVGSGMVSNPGVAARMFNRLCKENIPVKMVSTSEIKVSVVVPQEDMVRAANALHDEFNLVEEYV